MIARKMVFAAAIFATGTAIAALVPVAAHAEDKAAATYAEIEKTFGFVPSYFKVYPAKGVAGAWALTRDFEMKEDTALPVKTRALIGLAVAAQIPCDYCVFADSHTARAAGATEEEIREAVGQAALTRHWSTIVNGMQIDLDAFKAEFAGD